LDRLNQHCDAGHFLAALPVVTTWAGNASIRRVQQVAEHVDDISSSMMLGFA